MTNIKKTILETNEEFYRKYQFQNEKRKPIYINAGLCNQYAQSLAKKIKGAREMNIDNFWIRNHNAKIDYSNPKSIGKWDFDKLKSVNKEKTNYPKLFDELFAPPYHAWVYYKGKHYDAECESGVDNIFELPYFKHFADIKDEKREKTKQGLLNEQTQALKSEEMQIFFF